MLFRLWTSLTLFERICAARCETVGSSERRLKVSYSVTEQNVTVVTAVMNRGEQLLRSLASWVDLDEISDIIIVDWSSSEPLAQVLEGFSSSKIRVIRVDGRKRWHLTEAFNTGLRYVTSSQVLKLDADHVLHEQFFFRNTLLPYTFVAGDWRAQGRGQAGLNGFLWAWSDDLFSAGGWDERIRGYGWDDSDLIDRLQRLGLHKKTLARSSVKHLPHSSRERNKHEGVESPLPPKVHTQINRIMTARRAPWRRSDFIEHFVRSENRNRRSQVRLDEWLLARVAVSDDVRPAVARLAKSRHFLTPLWQRARFRFKNFYARARGERTLVVHVRHGLGNRFRTLASAALVAQSTGARLIVGWVPDEHCGAALLDLIDYRGLVVSTEQELEIIARDRRVAVINLMDDGRPNYKNRQLRLRKKTTFVRSSSAIRHLAVSPTQVNRTIATWSPSREVGRLADHIGSGFDLGIHVRQGNYHGALTPSFEREAGNWSSAAEQKLRAARSNTSAESFHGRLRPMVDIGSSAKNLRVYLCADSSDAENNIREFLLRLGVAQITFGGNGADRSREGVIRAMADSIVLASANDFVGSPYSAFSDLVTGLRLENVESNEVRYRLQKLALRL